MSHRNPGSLKRATASSLALALVTLAGLSVGRVVAAEMTVEFEHDGDPVYRVLAPGEIPAIEDPGFVSGETGDLQMSAEEPVFGLVIDGEARAYSLWQLDRHEIVNDEIGGVALAATW
jgi:hypothetical protein